MVSATIIRSLELAIPYREVLHFLEYPPDHVPPPRIERLALEVIPEARALAAPVGCYLTLPVDRAPEVGLESVAAERLVIGLVTAGPAIEARAQELIAAGQLTRGLVMDAAGSAAAEEAAELLSRHIVGAGGAAAAGAALSTQDPPPPALGRSTGCRVSPGYGSWQISWQPALFALLPHTALGVTLTPTFMMIPRKSISFALWLGARGPLGKGVGGCRACSLAQCRYRRDRPGEHARPASPSPSPSPAPEPAGGLAATEHQPKKSKAANS